MKGKHSSQSLTYTLGYGKGMQGKNTFAVEDDYGDEDDYGGYYAEDDSED